MPLDDALSAEAAGRPGLGAGRAGLALVCLQADPKLKHLAASIAGQERATTALKLLFPAPWCWHCRAWRERQLPIIVAAVVLSGCQQLHGQAQCAQVTAKPKLPHFGRHLLLDEGLVLQRARGQLEQAQIIPAELAAALLRVHLLPEAVSDPSSGAASGKAHFHEIGAKDLEDVQNHVSSAGARSAWQEALVALASRCVANLLEL